MDFNFSDDQQQLRDAVRRWVDKAYTFEHRRSAVQAGGFSGDTWTQLADLGLTALTVPETYGGMGLGFVDTMVVMEELGRGMVLEPLAQAYIASEVLTQYAPDAVKTQWLPRIATGESVVVLAHQERKSRYRLDQCTARASKHGNSYTVLAHKSVVPVGDKADAFLVPAVLEDRQALFLVECTAEGVKTRGYGTQDGGRAAELECQNSPATLITTSGLEALQLAVDVGSACVCAEAVGAMEQTLLITADYLNQRKQFGVAISSFQALRHRIADMKMQLELARSMSYYANLQVRQPAESRHRAISRARVQLGQSMRFVGQQAVQLHGGIGITDEYIISHFFKKLTQLEMTYGDSLHHLGEVSAHMQDTAGVME